MLDAIASGFDQILLWVDKVNPGYLYLIFFAMAFMENIIPPIPGDTFTIIGGYLAASGKISVTPAFLAITTGSMASIMFIYWLGYRKGHDYFVARDFKFFNAHDVANVERWFARYGYWTLISSRFVVGARVAIAVGAGISRVKTWRMFIGSYISTILFHGTLIALAFLMQAYISDLVDGFNIYSKIVLVAVGILIILWLILIVRRVINGRKRA